MPAHIPGHSRRMTDASPTDRSRGIDPRELGDDDLVREVTHLHETRHDAMRGASESAFVRVHDNNYLPAAKRLYMTATPRIYDDSSKTKAGEANGLTTRAVIANDPTMNPMIEAEAPRSRA